MKSENTTLSNKLEKLSQNLLHMQLYVKLLAKTLKPAGETRWPRLHGVLSFSKQFDTSLQRAVYNFHTTIIIKTIIGSSISMKLAYQTQIKQYNDQSHLVCGEHGFVLNKINTSIKKTVHKKIDLKVQCDMQALFM